MNVSKVLSPRSFSFKARGVLGEKTSSLNTPEEGLWQGPKQ